MSYKLIYTKSAVADINNLDSVAKNRIRKKLESFQKDPLYYSKKLTSSSLGSYRFRVGNYRIIFDLDKEKIVILRIGHRREIYK